MKTLAELQAIRDKMHDKVARVVEEHLKGGKPVVEYTIGNEQA